MIVCSCNIISKRDIENTIIELLKDDPWRLIVPGVVYQTMSARGKCCGCFPGVVDIIVETTQKFHEEQQTPSADIINFVTKLKEHHQACETARMLAKHRQKMARKTA
ncbi:MAG: (2Fe-2S)-binding protein [Lentilitoribacter sp.]